MVAGDINSLRARFVGGRRPFMAMQFPIQFADYCCHFLFCCQIVFSAYSPQSHLGALFASRSVEKPQSSRRSSWNTSLWRATWNSHQGTRLSTFFFKFRISTIYSSAPENKEIFILRLPTSHAHFPFHLFSTTRFPPKPELISISHTAPSPLKSHPSLKQHSLHQIHSNPAL